MTRPLPDEDGALTPAAAELVLEATERGDALVVGPGFGRSEGALALARDLAARAAIPLVLDADGLNAHAGALATLQARAAPAVLTPHEGELGRLMGVPSAEVAAHRLHFARAAAQMSGAIVVLKGDDTLVARPDGFVAVNPGASAGLATAGTGDVLSGVVAALLARHVEPFTAACAAVHLHAEAGRVAAERRGVDGTIASDVIDALPDARTRLLERCR